MQELLVELEERSYPIIIENDILTKVGTLISRVTGTSKLLLVSNPIVFALYGKKVKKSLQKAGFEITTSLMPDGEKYKNMDEAIHILDIAVKAQLDRSSIVVALGGGVVGDLAGFVASIFLRGINFIQIPTTLLAQVDSSVGGKVAVNHPGGKNLIGSFYQPKMVIIDPHTLNTLTDREYYAGWGEIVKYGIIADEEFFVNMEQNVDAINNKDFLWLQKMIYQSCKIKANIVEKDEKETGLRMILNLGHTFGHSIEKITNYNTYRHGEAVAMGIVAASYLACDLGYIAEKELERIINLIKNLQLEAALPEIDSETIYQGMLNDKKVWHDKLRLVLPCGLGNHKIVDNTQKDRIIKAINKAKETER